MSETRNPVCVVCGASVASRQPPRMPGLPPVCDQLRCRTRAVDQLRAQQSASRLRTLRAQVHGRGDVIFTPANRQPTAPLSATRRRRFLQHLDTVFGAVSSGEQVRAQQGWVGVSMSGENVHLPPETPTSVHQAIAAACATCRGWCCRTGSTTAWITPDTIQRVMLANPTLDAAALTARYMSQLPLRAYSDSCVYHSARGCGLEPSLRSDTCHTFLCDGANELVHLVRARADETVGSGPDHRRDVHVAATEGSRVVRVGRVLSYGSPARSRNTA